MEDRTTRSAGRLAVLLRTQREDAGLTQRELASRAGISLGALQDLEQGRTTRPRRQSLDRLAAVLRLTADQHEELVGASAGADAAGRTAAGSGRPPGAGLGGAEPGRNGMVLTAARNGHRAARTGPGAGPGGTGAGGAGNGNSGLRVEIRRAARPSRGHQPGQAA